MTPSLPAARSVLRAADLQPAQDEKPADRLTLSYEDRHLRRRRVTTATGKALLIDLAEPVSLDEGDLLVLDDGAGFVRVEAADEPLAEVLATGRALARLAWHVGNRHTPCDVREDRLLIRRDHVLEDMLTRLGGSVVHVDGPFRPEGGAYGHGRTHGHSHSHDPHADPNAHIPHRHDGHRHD